MNNGRCGCALASWPRESHLRLKRPEKSADFDELALTLSTRVFRLAYSLLVVLLVRSEAL